MKIRYTEGPDELSVAPAGKPGFTATRGEWVEVDNDVGKSLLAQGWEAESKARGAKSERE
jgi:hypothetical protein